MADLSGKGYDGTLFTREQYAAALGKVRLPQWIKGVVIHCTAVSLEIARNTPYPHPQPGAKTVMSKGPDQAKAFSQRMKNMKADVDKRLGGKGPHVVAFENGMLGKGLDITQPSNSHHTWNSSYVAIEQWFDGNSNDPLTSAGQKVVDLAAWWTAQILRARGLQANAATIKYHREEPRAKQNGKQCPGTKMEPKDMFIERVKKYMDAVKAAIAPVITPPGTKSRAQQAMDILTGPKVGWPKHWAAGLVGNAQEEAYADLRTHAAGDKDKDGNPTAFTIWQLRETRRAGYEGFAKMRGKDSLDFETQVLWMPHEIASGSEKLAWAWLQKADDVEQACAAGALYERPAGYIPKNGKAAQSWSDVLNVVRKVSHWEKRLAYARALMK